MSKIYYNVKQFKNALATGLLGLATLAPMTSCEKNEPDKIEKTYNSAVNLEEIKYFDKNGEEVEFNNTDENVITACSMTYKDGYEREEILKIDGTTVINFYNDNGQLICKIKDGKEEGNKSELTKEELNKKYPSYNDAFIVKFN